MATKPIGFPDHGTRTSDAHAADEPGSGAGISTMAVIQRVLGRWRDRRAVSDDLAGLAGPAPARLCPDQPPPVLEADIAADRIRRDDWQFCPKNYEFDLMTRGGAARP